MMKQIKLNHPDGFTLIEVLIALAVIAIALAALIKASAQDVAHTAQIKDKSISHWVEMQGITAIQLGLIPTQPNQEISQVTKMLGQRWYWRATVTPISIKNTQQISISVSPKASGPFTDTLIAFKYTP